MRSKRRTSTIRLPLPPMRTQRSPASAKIDVALYVERQTNRRNRQCQLCGQPLAPLQLMFSHCLAHCLLNLALSGDAKLFEQLSDARVENVLLHRALPRSLARIRSEHSWAGPIPTFSARAFTVGSQRFQPTEVLRVTTKPSCNFSAIHILYRCWQ